MGEGGGEAAGEFEGGEEEEPVGTSVAEAHQFQCSLVANFHFSEGFPSVDCLKCTRASGCALTSKPC
jgi:hypothetical protein